MTLAEIKIKRKEAFYASARQKHGDRFGYHDDYVNASTKIKITCRDHGEVTTLPTTHLDSEGCPKCSKKVAKGKLRLSHDDFIARARVVHGGFFSYPDSYVSSTKKIKIHCPKHGDFSQTPAAHIRGDSCPECATDKSRKGLSWWIETATIAHGGKYDYSKVDYESVSSRVIVRCPEHGEFTVHAGNHALGKSHCPYCSGKRVGFDSFVSRSVEIHGNDYDYSSVEFNGMKTPVEIKCNSCRKTFQQKPHCHMYDEAGCQACCFVATKGQKDIATYVESLGVGIFLNDRDILNPYEIDVWVPDFKLGIEYNGVYWHQDTYVGGSSHQQKWKRAKRAGVNLLQIFEDEWLLKEPLVRAMLLHRLGKSRKIFARKCQSTPISGRDGRAFFEQNHIQGADKASHYYGLMHGGSLVSVISFGKPRISGGDKSVEWDLSRFATAQVAVVGGFSKLLSLFIRDQKPSSIGTYADLRWGDGEVYLKNGFTHSHITPPNYWYVNPKQKPLRRVHRFAYRKDRLKEMLGSAFDSKKTEREITKEMGLWRVYDAGNSYFTMNCK